MRYGAFLYISFVKGCVPPTLLSFVLWLERTFEKRQSGYGSTGYVAVFIHPSTHSPYRHTPLSSVQVLTGPDCWLKI